MQELFGAFSEIRGFNIFPPAVIADSDEFNHVYYSMLFL